MHIETKDQQSTSSAAVVTDERTVSTDVSPSAPERAISDPVIFSKPQVGPQNQVAAFSGPLKGFLDLPHDINLSLPNENISASNNKVRTLPDAGTLSIISNLTPGEPC